MHQLPLTPRQREFYAYLENQIARHGHSPSLRQAAHDMRISHTAVASLLHTLQEKGWLKREGRYSRNITLLSSAVEKDVVPQGKQIPIIGRVAAGLPLYAQEEWAGTVYVDSTLYRGNNLFALTIEGDSMKDVGILNGDLAICEPRQFAENGEIVVALIDHEEATVKRFFYRGDHIELFPENSEHQSMRFGLGDVLIQGKVIGIHRGPEQMKKL
ncbi:transcriptional repressor LexA [Desulfogranum japonicum]|uniref:transcriptional repressor LexA n=1 Tax=Desulfogranum japonicum TaxID=231447 RepID=UPI000411BD02|nr:transcriptional repressor LexA [Desulfogranum japonicum]